MIVRSFPTRPRRREGRALDAIVCLSILVYPIAGLVLGASAALMSIVLSASSMVLTLLVLRGERRRNATMHAVLDRLHRETRVLSSFQDR